MNSAKMRINEVQILGNLLAKSPFPDVLSNLFSAVHWIPQCSHLITKRYQSQYTAKRFTFLFRLRLTDVGAGIWKDSVCHMNKNNNSKYCLRVKKCGLVFYTATEPTPKLPVTALIFMLGNKIKDGNGEGCSLFDIPHNRMGEFVIFGANIFC